MAYPCPSCNRDEGSPVCLNDNRCGRAAVIKRVNFGSAAGRRRAEIADALTEVAEHIRAGELECQPHGWVLLLQSEDNPARYEVLNKGIATKDDMERALAAMRRHIATT